MCILLLGSMTLYFSLSSLLLRLAFTLLVLSSFVGLYYVLYGILITSSSIGKMQSEMPRSQRPKLRELWRSVVALKPKSQQHPYQEQIKIDRGAVELAAIKHRWQWPIKILGILAIVGLAYAIGNDHGYLKRDHELVTNVHFRSNAKVLYSDAKRHHIFLTSRGEEKINFCPGGPVFSEGTILSDMAYEIRQAPENCAVMTGGVPLGYTLASLSGRPNKEQ